MNNAQEHSSIMRKTTLISDKILMFLIYLSGVFTVALLIGIIVYVAVRGIGVIDWTFISTVQSAAKGTFGILGYLVNTLYIIILTLIIAVPIGIGAAIYLNEYAKRGRLVSLIETTTEVLSGIPSIIYGLFGMVFFGNTLHMGFSVICGSLTLTLMILPIIIRTTQESLKTVPDSYRQGALGMGASKWHIIRTIILPSSLSGIVTAVILAIGRITGESAALLFTAGSGYLLPKLADFGIFKHIGETGGSLVVGMYLNMSEGNIDNAFGMALILLIIVLLINMLTKVASSKLNRSGGTQ